MYELAANLVGKRLPVHANQQLENCKRSSRFPLFLAGTIENAITSEGEFHPSSRVVLPFLICVLRAVKSSREELLALPDPPMYSMDDVKYHLQS